MEIRNAQVCLDLQLIKENDFTVALMSGDKMIQGKIWLPMDRDLPQDFSPKEETHDDYRQVIDLKHLDDQLIVKL